MSLDRFFSLAFVIFCLGPVLVLLSDPFSATSLRAAGDQSSIQVPRRLQEQLEGAEASYQVQYSNIAIYIYYIGHIYG